MNINKNTEKALKELNKLNDATANIKDEEVVEGLGVLHPVEEQIADEDDDDDDAKMKEELAALEAQLKDLPADDPKRAEIEKKIEALKKEIEEESDAIKDDEEFDVEIVLTADEVAIGDAVVKGDKPVEDGTYDMDGLVFTVVDGKITEIDDDEEDPIEDDPIEDVVKKVKSGKVVKVTAEQLRNKKKARGGMSPKEYRAKIKSLKMARRKSHTGGADRKRGKSMKIRARKVKDDVGNVEGVPVLDFDKISTALRVFIHKMIDDKYELTDEQSQRLDEILMEAVPEPVINDGNLEIKFPKWVIEDDSIDIEQYEQFDASFSLEKDIDEESVVSGITDDFGLGEMVFV